MLQRVMRIGIGELVHGLGRSCVLRGINLLQISDLDSWNASALVDSGLDNCMHFSCPGLLEVSGTPQRTLDRGLGLLASRGLGVSVWGVLSVNEKTVIG